MSTQIADLNDRFAVPGQLEFAAGPGGLPVARIENEHASASVALLGGHVLTYQPRGQEPVLWLSRHSRFEPGVPIRGGVPVCWPWFSSHPTDKSKPFHGFARTMTWSVRGTETTNDGAARLLLGIVDDEQSRALWPHGFDAEIDVTVGRELAVRLVSRNPGDEPWTISCALHPYFTISAIQDIWITGLEGTHYLERSPEPQRQDGPIRFASEVDRVYLDTTADCIIHDPGLDRRIRIAKEGSRTTVVWNPWIERAATLDDYGDDEYLGMVCVESTNAKQDPVTVPGGGEHCLGAVISVEQD